MLLQGLLLCELSPVLGSVAWGQEHGDASRAPGCSPGKHPMLPAALAKVAKIPFLLSGSLLSRFSVRSEKWNLRLWRKKKKKR